MAVFRCTLSGQSLRWLEIPAWMFDRVVSSNWRITTPPLVNLAAIGALAILLREASGVDLGRGRRPWARSLTSRFSVPATVAVDEVFACHHDRERAAARHEK